jgi:hypothetical protein
VRVAPTISLEVLDMVEVGEASFFSAGIDLMATETAEPPDA